GRVHAHDAEQSLSRDPAVRRLQGEAIDADFGIPYEETVVQMRDADTAPLNAVRVAEMNNALAINDVGSEQAQANQRARTVCRFGVDLLIWIEHAGVIHQPQAGMG